MKSILYVDDDEEMIAIVKVVLANSGYRIRTATSGQDAIELCTSEQPDLVLMDLNMPGLDGFETTRQLRGQGFANPIVALTASESDEDREKAKLAGCDNYILKTLDMADVEGVIDEFLAEGGDFELNL